MIPKLIIFFGNIGAGKTSIAKSLAKRLGYESVHFDDMMWTATGHDRIYDDDDTFLLTKGETQKVYDLMHSTAKDLLKTKKGVILESLYFKTQREEAISIATKIHIPYCIIEVVLEDEITLERLIKRKKLNPQSSGIKLFREYKSWQEPEKRKHMTINNHGTVKEATDEIIKNIEEYTIT